MMKNLLLSAAILCSALTFTGHSRNLKNQKGCNEDNDLFINASTTQSVIALFDVKSERMIAFAEGATQKVKFAKSFEELDQIHNELIEKLEAITKEAGEEYKLTEKKMNALEIAAERYQEAYKEKTKELAILVGCTSPAQKLVVLLEEIIQKIENTQSMDELERIEEEFMEKIEAINNEAGEDYEPSKSEKTAIETAFQKYTEIYIRKEAELKPIEVFSTPIQRMITLVEEEINEIENAQSMYELERIEEEFMKKIKAINNEAGEDYEPSEIEKTQLDMVVNKYYETYIKKESELSE